MPKIIQPFLARVTKKAADDLIAAVERIPEDKRNWIPMGEARTALDQAAECAILNGSSSELAQTRAWRPEWNAEWLQNGKADLVAKGWPAIKSLLQENTAKMIATIEALPDEDLAIEIKMPWGMMPLAEEASYPYWNMTYHEGQINYIALMLGCWTPQATS